MFRARYISYAGRADLKESLQLGYDQRGWGSEWPLEPAMPGVRETSLAFMDQCHALCCKILQLFAVGLGLPADAFEKVLARPIFCCEKYCRWWSWPRPATKLIPSGCWYDNYFNLMRSDLPHCTAPMQVLHSGSFTCCTG